MREPMMSGHCLTPQTADPVESHDRCARNGGGNRACPTKEFAPCPCPCHYPAERYECEECGGDLAEAPLWPDEDAAAEESEPEVVFTHVDPRTGRATGFECPTSKRAQARAETVPEVSRTGPIIEAGDETDEEYRARLRREQIEAELDAMEEAEDEFESLLKELDEEMS